MSSLTTQLWQFFYINNEGENIAVGIIEAKKPQLTKKYKRNLKRLGRSNVRGVGYTLIR